MKITCFDSSNRPLKNLTQWEINRVVKISGVTCAGAVTCHIFNSSSEYAEVVPAEYAEGTVTTKIPNILLQESKSIVLGVYDKVEGKFGEGRFIGYFNIPVMPSTKPRDYEFIENIEYINWIELNEAAKEVLKNFEQKEIEMQDAVNRGNALCEELTALEQDINTRLKNGEFDGFSPKAKVETVYDKTIITITDANGTTRAEFGSGKNGEPGRDGYTPIKGVDYFDGEKGEPGKDGNVNFATFEIDKNGMLNMKTTDELKGVNFLINDNGYMEVELQ